MKDNELLASFITILSFLTFASCQQYPIPSLPKTFQSETDNNSIGSFVNLWKFAATNDVQESTLRNSNPPPRTVLGPQNFVFVNLVPQDVAHPLYLLDEANTLLRRDFVLNHLVAEEINADDPRITSPEGLVAKTMSGKMVVLMKDVEGQLVVKADGRIVPVRSVTALDDGTSVYELQDALFDSKAKVRAIFEKHDGINEPLGPPLEIPSFSFGGLPPAPPPSGFTLKSDSLPPSIPEGSFEGLPPAPPQSFRFDSTALRPSPPVGSPFGTPQGPPIFTNILPSDFVGKPSSQRSSFGPPSISLAGPPGSRIVRPPGTPLSGPPGNVQAGPPGNRQAGPPGNRPTGPTANRPAGPPGLGFNRQSSPEGLPPAPPEELAAQIAQVRQEQRSGRKAK